MDQIRGHISANMFYTEGVEQDSINLEANRAISNELAFYFARGIGQKDQNIEWSKMPARLQFYSYNNDGLCK